MEGIIESEIRKDYFLDRYVIIAPKRGKKPKKTTIKRDVSADRECYFCCPQVDDPKNQIQIKDYKDSSGNWEIKVIGNLYPALTLENIKAYGEQEIVIETPRHGIEIHELSLEHIVKIFDAYIDRYKHLKKTTGICHTQIFKNEGGRAGASIPHAHSQIISLPLVPPKIAKEALAINAYIDKNGTCPHCDIIKSEKGGPRVILEDEHLFVLSPYASESPYGAWFIPKRHIGSIEDLNHAEKYSLAKAFKKVLGKLDEIDVSYNYFIQNAVDDYDHHMLIKLAPRPNIWAGLELGTGVIINSVSPEEAARFYRN
ncbi:hypothetical protein K0A96_02590 [Patescibacteria group bacterium]|nr:hypothetical protein [Patescibacteria group bacterium]